MKLIWMSDLHFAATGDVLGHDPRARLDAAIDHANRLHDDASLCVLSGDLVDRANPEEYAALKEHLDTLAMPYLPMVGNHDARTPFRATLPMPPGTMPDFMQYAHRTAEGLILCLDTVNPDSDTGQFCTQRMAWLKEALEAAGGIPVYIFGHHPPMPLGLPMLDDSRIEEGEALLDLLASHDCVRHCFFGHVHRPITGAARGIPFAIMRSILLQAPPPRPNWTWETFAPSREAPAIGVVTLRGGDVTVQYEEFCDADFGVQAS